MRIQPIASNYMVNHCNVKRKQDEPVNQPNFKGLKGFLTGGAIGSGLTAGGIALIAGTTVLPAFLGYIIVNGTLSAVSGHLIQNKINENN